VNYYDARELKDADGNGTGRWHYTCANRRIGTWAVGYCRDHDGHETPEEARKCFRRYLLDGAFEESYADWSGCVVCDAPTKKGLTTRPPLGHGYPLCDEHRALERLAELAEVPGQIMASY
jgi:hypothetical protein